MCRFYQLVLAAFCTNGTNEWVVEFEALPKKVFAPVGLRGID